MPATVKSAAELAAQFLGSNGDSASAVEILAKAGVEPAFVTRHGQQTRRYYDAEVATAAFEAAIAARKKKPGKPLAEKPEEFLGSILAGLHHLDDELLSLAGEIQKFLAAHPALRKTSALLACRSIVNLIEAIENRCMAADGPVTPTSEEITEAELKTIYEIAKAGA